MMALEVLYKIGNSLLTVLISALFFHSFMQRTSSKKKLIALGILSFLIVLISEFVFDTHPFSYLMVFSGCVVLSVAYSSNVLHGAFYSCIFTVLLMIVENTVRVLMEMGFGVPDGDDFSKLSFLSVLLSKAIMFLIIQIIYVLKYKPFSNEADKKYLTVIAFPLASALAILTQNALVIKNDNWEPTIVCLILISNFALLFATMIVFEYINSLYDLAMHKSKIEHANKIIEVQASQYRSMMENNFETNKIKHDLRNYCIGIAAELKAGNVDTALDKLCDIYGENSLLKDDSGSSIEFILKTKAEKAAAVGVKIIWECVNIQNIKISDVDLAIILGNALDNAVEAVEKIEGKGTVEALVVSRNNLLVIKIKNPVKENVDTNNLSSTKSDNNAHGFGIISMKQLADKYDGEVLFTCKDNVFTTSIVMKNTIPKA